MKERYQELEEKNEALHEYVEGAREKGTEFLNRLEMSWIYHDNALEGIVYQSGELAAALGPASTPREASMLPAVLEIRHHKSACDYARQEAEQNGKKNPQITLPVITRIHDLMLGNTPEAQAARAAIGIRDKTEKEKEKEKERFGFRKDMPLHRTYFHEIAQPAKIQPMLEKFVEYTGSSEFRESHPIKQAAVVQHQFMQIFPFVEQSGKVGRMLSNLVLFRHGFYPVIIHTIDRQKYYESLRGPANTFRLLVMDALENALDNGLKHFRDMARRYK